MTNANMNTQGRPAPDVTPAAHTAHPHENRVLRETKTAFKTTEFWIFLVVSIAILIAAAVTDNGDDGQGFSAAQAWSYVAILAVGYMISRGLAKIAVHARGRDRDAD